ncbi:plasmid replication DNA-binding protein KfrA [Collimonas sp. PA-H2]|uniref:DNA-binding protein n=1 Tax=Collimonas sp. PA-H2 TaxID=1881062 RepID=UPI000BF5047E|nr:DNA-binding protein [Collimonas sp. PA-H2]PFH12445.1 plasmid replication DNA-binding protein KfrA [Collimonas sp. PA-H2]
MSERQNLSWTACDTLAAQGKKPSIGLVREWTIASTGAKKGSDGDVQKDINEWYADLLKLKRDKGVAGLPDAVATLTRELWRYAVESANDTLAAERTVLAGEKAEAEKLIDLAQEDTLAAIDIANELKGKLTIAHADLLGRDQQIKRLEQALAEQRATLQAKDERIGGLAAELGRKAEEHAGGLAELDGLRKHSLLEIDRARAESRQWKAEFTRIEAESKSAAHAYREKISMLESELSGAKGRLGAIEESLATANKRVEIVEAELSAAKLASGVSRQGLGGSKKPGAGRLVRRR